MHHPSQLRYRLFPAPQKDPLCPFPKITTVLISVTVSDFAHSWISIHGILWEVLFVSGLFGSILCLRESSMSYLAVVCSFSLSSSILSYNYTIIVYLFYC